MEAPHGNEQSDLVKLAAATMPFGKHAGRRLIDLPEEYILWFKQKGYPSGELGRQMEAVLELKVNGLEYLLRPLAGGDRRGRMG
jgi:uncharacterized protein (DUF3820 family)